jgi:hypothetical protein
MQERWERLEVATEVLGAYELEFNLPWEVQQMYA